ncbi:hypothetical protein VTN02DRAFT_6319 [Thermoascus thermophilus]
MMTESRPFLRNDKHLQHAILLVRSPQVLSTGTLRQFTTAVIGGICAIPRPGWLAAAGFPISKTRAGPSEPFCTVTSSYLQRAGPPAAGRVSSCIDTLGGAGRLRGPPASCSRAFVAILARRSPWNPFSNFSAPVRSTVC